MNVRTLTVGALAVAALIGGGAYAMSRGSSSGDSMGGMAGMNDGGTDASGGMPEMLPVGNVSGLSASADGYSIKLASTRLSSAEPTRISFSILGPDLKPVRDFQVDATKKMHLIIVRRDLTNYQHIHPTMASDGTWSIDAQVAAPGRYRAFADFATDGKRHVLGADLRAPGTSTSVALPQPKTTTRVDGFDVTLHAGMLMSGQEAALRFSVSRGGAPATMLEPYLGNLGHLVILREKTLQYLHVHPTSSGGSGPEIRFAGELARPGRYRAFLQFQVNGTVHTAAFTLETHGAM